MKHVFRNRDGARQTVVRDKHAPEAIYVKTETADKAGLKANERIRNAELLKRDARNPMVDGDVIAFSFSFPTVMDYELAKRRHPDLFLQVTQGSDSERMRAAERLQFLFPQFVTTVTRGDARRHNARQTVQGQHRDG